MDRTLRRLAVVGFVVALFAVALGGTLAQSTAGSVEPADEIFVRENGDAVLRYAAEPDPDAPETLEFEADVAENLAYGIVTDPVEHTPTVRGQFDLAATRSTMETQGGLSAPKPEGLNAFALDLRTESTDQTSSSELSASATVRDTSGATGFVKSVSSSGRVETGTSTVAVDGRLDVRSNVPLGERRSLEATLSESAPGYTLAVDRARPVDERMAREWADRNRATRLLNGQYEAIARRLGGSVAVEVDRVDVTETDTGFRLRQVYTAQFSGLDSGLESLLRTALSENPRFEPDQVDRLATALAAVQVNEASVEYTLDGRNLNASMRLDVRNYADLILAYLETLDALGDGGPSLDRLRTRFEARQAAGLAQTITWDAGLGHPESGVVEFTLDVATTDENRAAYVDELKARDIRVLTQEVELTGATSGDRLEFDGRATLAGEALFDTLLDGLPAADELSPRSAAIVEGVQASDPDRAKLVGSYDGDGLRLEAGASFEDLAALQEALGELGGIPRVTSVVSRLDGGSGSTYLRLHGATPGGASEADVRALPYVGEDTTIHLPGTWERDFPTMNVDRARSFLSDVGAGSSGPGFGPVVAAVAILAAAILFWSRQ